MTNVHFMLFFFSFDASIRLQQKEYLFASGSLPESDNVQRFWRPNKTTKKNKRTNATKISQI